MDLHLPARLRAFSLPAPSEVFVDVLAGGGLAEVARSIDDLLEGLAGPRAAASARWERWRGWRWASHSE
jgi:hypothetical protein